MYLNVDVPEFNGASHGTALAGLVVPFVPLHVVV